MRSEPRRRWSSACAFLALVSLVVVAGCGSGRVVLALGLEPSSLKVPSDRSELSTHERSMRGIAAIMVKTLELPVPDRVTAFVYGSRGVFEQGLIKDGRVSPARAAELGHFAVGIGRPRQLLLNGEVFHRDRVEWLRLIAHEMAHVSQIELAGGEGRAAQWFAEGMAEWVAFNVLEQLQLDTVAARRTQAVRGARALASVQLGRLDLDALGSPRGFTVRHLQDGSLATYQLSFVMADYLIARRGFGAAVDYYRSFSAADTGENFRRAFGVSLGAFEPEILAYLKDGAR